jgi:hypothetical protein
LSAFDAPFWTPLQLLAWAWVHDAAILDDPKLSELRLTMLGSGIRYDAPPADVPSPSTQPPLPRWMTSKFPTQGYVELAAPPTRIDPALSKLPQVKAEILNHSQRGLVEWSGRRPGSNHREKIPALDFVDAEIEYQKAHLERTDPRDRAELSQPRVIWRGLRAARCSILRLYPPPRVPSPSPSSPSPAPSATQRTPAQEVLLARDFLGHCARTGEPPLVKVFAEKIGRNPRTARDRLQNAVPNLTPKRGGRRAPIVSTWVPS